MNDLISTSWIATERSPINSFDLAYVYTEQVKYSLEEWYAVCYRLGAQSYWSVFKAIIRISKNWTPPGISYRTWDCNYFLFWNKSDVTESISPHAGSYLLASLCAGGFYFVWLSENPGWYHCISSRYHKPNQQSASTTPKRNTHQEWPTQSSTAPVIPTFVGLWIVFG